MDNLTKARFQRILNKMPRTFTVYTFLKEARALFPDDIQEINENYRAFLESVAHRQGKSGKQYTRNDMPEYRDQEIELDIDTPEKINDAVELLKRHGYKVQRPVVVEYQDC